MERPKATALEQAMKLLTVRGHTRKELAEKLRRRGYSVAEINDAVESCLRYGFLNDAQLGEDYAAILAARGCGQFLIDRKLREKGLSPEDVANARNSVQESEVERAKAALDLKLRLISREKDPRKKREKCYRFLISRGFSSASIAAAMGFEEFADE